jgi:hypothetical protein
MAKHHARKEKFLVKTGRLLSNSGFVARALAGYVLLSFTMYLWLVIDLGHWRGDSGVIAYDVALGGSPLSYDIVLSRFPFLFIALEVFHGLAWLIVPVLAATMVDAAYRTFEEDRRRKETELRRSIGRWARKQGMSTEAAKEFTDEAMDTFPLGLKKKGRKGPKDAA